MAVYKSRLEECETQLSSKSKDINQLQAELAKCTNEYQVQKRRSLIYEKKSNEVTSLKRKMEQDEKEYALRVEKLKQKLECVQKACRQYEAQLSGAFHESTEKDQQVNHRFYELQSELNRVEQQNGELALKHKEQVTCMEIKISEMTVMNAAYNQRLNFRGYADFSGF